MDATTQAWLDQQDSQVAEIIRTYGWFIQYVGGGCSVPGCDCPTDQEPPFAYTVGLFGLGHPELLVFGLEPNESAHLLNDLGSRVKEGEALLPGLLLTFDHWSRRAIPEDVPNPEDIVFAANRFYQRSDEASVPVLQISYDDEDGRFPWEEGHSEPEMQPRPGSFRAL